MLAEVVKGRDGGVPRARLLVTESWSRGRRREVWVLVLLAMLDKGFEVTESSFLILSRNWSAFLLTTPRQILGLRPVSFAYWIADFSPVLVLEMFDLGWMM